MASVFKKLFVLVWKCIVLRLRNIFLTIFELICPILVVLLVYGLNYLLYKVYEKETTNLQDYEFSNKDLLYYLKETDLLSYTSDSAYIIYAPKNALTDEIMEYAKRSVVANRNNYPYVTIKSVLSEEELETSLVHDTLPHSLYSCVLGVVFLNPAQRFLKLNSKVLKELEEPNKNPIQKCKAMLSSLQDHLDTQIQNDGLLENKIAKVLIGELFQDNMDSDKGKDKEEMQNVKATAILIIMYILLVLAYTFLVTAVIRDTVQEKSSGIKELMRIMGLSSWMIWFHWFIYSLIVQLPVTVCITFLLTVIPPVVFHANTFIVWVLFLLVTITYIAFLFFVSCFFDRATKATILCVVAWVVINFGLLYVFQKMAESEFFLQVIISFIPLINLCWAIQTLNSFHVKGVDWSLSYLFTEGYSHSKVSPGLSIIILLCEIIIFAVLLAYLDAVKPGHYGVAKPPTFIFAWLVNLIASKEPTTVAETSLPSNFESPPRGTKVGIQIRGLHKKFGVFHKVVAVENVNLDIYENEVTVLLGHNGAGKTTTMSMITGLFSPTRGTVSVDGKNIYDNIYHFRQNLGLCTQHNLYFPKLTVLEHLIFFGMLKGGSYSKAKREGNNLLYMLNMAVKKDLRGSKLSGGMQRRLCLAVALTGAPKVLILDEPTSGLDPENRRHIWDIILSLRGERTILITTHYMEEADVLGDRIAIMDHGQVVCCGTTMFLKKLYGTGYCIHVSVRPGAYVDEITQLVGRIIPQFKTKEVSKTQVDYHIKDEYKDKFPDLFSNLERSKSPLNITGISVACTTMEDVFLRVAELSEEHDRHQGGPDVAELEPGGYVKVEGITLFLQHLEAMVIKRFKNVLKRIISLLIKIIIACLFILGAVLIVNELKIEKVNKNMNKLQKEIGLPFSPSYEATIKARKLDQNNVDKYMTYAQNTRRSTGSSEVVNYLNSTHNVSTSSARLAADTVLNQVHDNGTIQLLDQVLVSGETGCSTAKQFANHFLIQFCMVIFFTIALTTITSDLLPMLIEERVKGFKYQQIIAGISPIFYWLSNFLCDFCIYLIIFVIWFIIIVASGSEVVPISSENMGMLILVLILSGASSIIFLYAFSYISSSSAVVNGLYVVISIASALILPLVFSIYFLQFSSLLIQMIATSILSLHPSIAFVLAIESISYGIARDNVCDLKPYDSLFSFLSEDNRLSCMIYVIMLVVDCVLYSVVVLLMESNLWAKMRYKRSVIYDPQGGDEDVKVETQRVRMFKEARVDTTPLRVEGLVKIYGKLRAASHVSFLVTRGECFGLLGVNGAGKTTTFKMLTGEITPTSGDAFSGSHSVMTQTRRYLAHIGYCPQFDAILDDLTGRETLTVIALIRGVPRGKVHEQAVFWMTALGIEEHADKRTMTYSGGTKRKLGTAMAFIGDPEVALMDEPTTGVDPAARRKVWGAVQGRQRAGLSAVLSSHSMEECEALCSRLTIMRRGELCCLGSVQQLKNKFGQGYVALLKLALTEDNFSQLDALKKDFLRSFPNSVVQDENVNVITYRVLDARTPLSRLFSEMIRIEEKYSVVEDFIVSSATLEQLFLAIARDQETRVRVSG